MSKGRQVKSPGFQVAWVQLLEDNQSCGFFFFLQISILFNCMAESELHKKLRLDQNTPFDSIYHPSVTILHCLDNHLAYYIANYRAIIFEGMVGCLRSMFYYDVLLRGQTRFTLQVLSQLLWETRTSREYMGPCTLWAEMHWQR